MTKKNILILSFTDQKQDPRVYRQIETLEDQYNIYTIGSSSSDRNTTFIPFIPPTLSLAKKIWITLLSLTHQFSAMYWHLHGQKESLRTTKQALDNTKIDLIIANDIETLPFAKALEKNCPILFDAHEYYPHQHHYFRWKLIFGRYYHDLCNTHIPQTQAISTVSQGILDLYRTHYTLPNHQTIIRNIPPQEPLKPKATNTPVKLIHHGVSHPDRNLDALIRIVESLNGEATLDLMLVKTHNTTYKTLVEQTKATQHCRVIPPVPREDIAKTINHYDIGIFLPKNTSSSLKYCLPNKIFEFIQARLMCLTSNHPELDQLIQEHNLGQTVDPEDESKIIKQLLTLTPETIDTYKKNSHKAAKTLNQAQELKKLDTLIKEILK